MNKNNFVPFYDKNSITNSEPRKKSKIICCRCGEESILQNYSIEKRYKILGDHYCEYCVPKRMALDTNNLDKNLNPLKYSLALRNSNCENKDYITCKCEKCGEEFTMSKRVVKDHIIDSNTIYCKNCRREYNMNNEKASHTYRRSKTTIKCSECGKEFSISYERMIKRKEKYGKDLCLSCSKKGSRNPFYDRKFTEESINKISNSKKEFYKSEKGQQAKDEQIARQLKNVSPMYLLDENGNRLRLLNFREQLIIEKDFTCEKCKKKFSEVILEVHHLDSVDKNNDKIFDRDNVVLLCTECHRIFHIMYGHGNNTKAQFESYKQESSETIENAANRLKVSRVGFSKSEMGGTDDLSKKE